MRKKHRKKKKGKHARRKKMPYVCGICKKEVGISDNKCGHCGSFLMPLDEQINPNSSEPKNIIKKEKRVETDDEENTETYAKSKKDEPSVKSTKTKTCLGDIIRKRKKII